MNPLDLLAGVFGVVSMVIGTAVILLVLASMIDRWWTDR